MEFYHYQRSISHKILDTNADYSNSFSDFKIFEITFSYYRISIKKKKFASKNAIYLIKKKYLKKKFLFFIFKNEFSKVLFVIYFILFLLLSNNSLFVIYSCVKKKVNRNKNLSKKKKKDNFINEAPISIFIKKNSKRPSLVFFFDVVL